MDQIIYVIAFWLRGPGFHSAFSAFYVHPERTTICKLEFDAMVLFPQQSASSGIPRQPCEKGGSTLW